VVDLADQADLSPVSRALLDRPEFLSGWLAATPSAGELLTDRLRLTPAALQRLLVSRAPRPQRFAADVGALADFVGVAPELLAAALREAAALAALSSAPLGTAHEAEHLNGLLAAAHDTVEEQIPQASGAVRLRCLAAATWEACPLDTRQSSDVEAAVVWSALLAIVTLPQLALSDANRWLDSHGIPGPTVAEDRPLRGLLVAWRGHGLIFVDGSLSIEERRFTIAHEQGHFLLDYDEPRRRVLAEAPDLLDVIDGYRPPTAADRARAALARVSLGAHTHLLQRDSLGGANGAALAAEDEASLYALELLVPWDALLVLLRRAVSTDQAYAEKLRSAAEAVIEEFRIPAEPATSRAALGLAALGVKPGFFDR
jgi:hypothetical protein